MIMQGDRDKGTQLLIIINKGSSYFKQAHICYQEATESKIQPGVSQNLCFLAILFPILQPPLLCWHLGWSACFHLLINKKVILSSTKKKTARGGVLEIILSNLHLTIIILGWPGFQICFQGRVSITNSNWLIPTAPTKSYKSSINLPDSDLRPITYLKHQRTCKYTCH